MPKSVINKSRKYLLNLSLEDRKKLAIKMKPNKPSFQAYLYQIGKELRTPSRGMAVLLEKATAGKVKSEDFEREAFKKVSA